MNQSSKFALIARIKNFISSRGHFQVHQRTQNVSEDVARKIQRGAYEQSQKTETPTFYPPYQELAEQLQVANEQIFIAAVYNLAKIAVNSEHYRNHICQLLEETLYDENRSQEEIDYIKLKLDSIKAV